MFGKPKKLRVKLPDYKNKGFPPRCVLRYLFFMFGKVKSKGLIITEEGEGEGERFECFFVLVKHDTVYMAKVMYAVGHIDGCV